MFKNKKSFVSFFDDDDEVLALTKYCEWKNCQKKGEYKAPTSRANLREFKWFCLEHVKIYNKAWDYFKGRTSDEIYSEISNDARWHRPTWKKIKKNNFYDIHNLNLDDKNNTNNFNSKTLNKKENNHLENYLKILEVKMPLKLSDLKIQYKKMVKKFHPDVSKNNTEEHIIKLNNAYTELLKFLK